MRKGTSAMVRLAMVRLAFVLMVPLLMPVLCANAASVRDASLNEMLENSQLVFEGRVTAVEARKGGLRRVHTYVTFEIIDVIKGSYDRNSITLRFLGGTVGDMTLAVSDMRMPENGEHGIYFVESLQRTQVNPLYGWSQGHFIVDRDRAGVRRIMTNKRLPVTKVKDETPDGRTARDRDRKQALSQGVSPDLVVAQQGREDSGLTVDEFKKILHQRLGKSR